jgi:hypothetical protein
MIFVIAPDNFRVIFPVNRVCILFNNDLSYGLYRKCFRKSRPVAVGPSHLLDMGRYGGGE